MNWLKAVILPLCAVHYIKCTEHDDYYNKDKGLIFDAFPGSILSFPINTKDIQQQTTQVPDKMECVFACIGVPWCRSMNFKTTAQKNGLHVCELLSTDKHAHPNNMTQNSTFTHFSIKNPCAETPCLNDGTCILQNNRQDYRCECKKGFDGSNCQNDVNECTAGTHNCHTHATCTNTVGSFTCQCKPGYQGNGQTCSDVNECTGGTHNCHTYATCTNTVGSFTCQCKPGYKARSVTFTNLGATGRFGPTSIGSHYDCQSHQGQVTLSSGIQIWRVPHTGSYRIEAVGASGGYDSRQNSKAYRGRGARMIGTVKLVQGELIKILVGQEGGNNTLPSSGGGGGSFVVRNDNTPLIIAGGGGGIESASRRYSRADASVSTSGNPGYGGSQWAGGRDGQGANVADSSNSGGGGGGFFSSGRSSTQFGGSRGYGGEGGKGFLQGGAGGRSYRNSVLGGFGGGGGAYGGGGGAGGGGGYSGGASGDNYYGSSGGGGGSLNSGTDQSNTCCYNDKGHGYVLVTRVLLAS